MLNGYFQLAFIGPGGPEIMVVMLVLIMVFGAKDAPKIFRKINEMLNSVRNTADSFKREIMYGDLNSDTSVSDEHDTYSVDDEYHDDDYDYTDENEERDYSDETFQSLEKDLEEAEPGAVSEENVEPDQETVSEASDEKEDDVQKS